MADRYKVSLVPKLDVDMSDLPNDRRHGVVRINVRGTLTRQPRELGDFAQRCRHFRVCRRDEGAEEGMWAIIGTPHSFAQYGIECHVLGYPGTVQQRMLDAVTDPANAAYTPIMSAEYDVETNEFVIRVENSQGGFIPPEALIDYVDSEWSPRKLPACLEKLRTPAAQPMAAAAPAMAPMTINLTINLDAAQLAACAQTGQVQLPPMQVGT